MSPLLTARDLSVTLGRRPVLRGVNLTLAAGEIVAILGPNGSGKSTLLRALLGLVPAQGRLWRAPGLRVGLVPQALRVDPALPLSVGRFLSLPRRVPRAEAAAALAAVGLPDLMHRPLSALSGGQAQRVQLARALVGRPQLLVLDEATQGLDRAGAAAFDRLIAQARDQTGCAVLMVSHDWPAVRALADRVIGLDGRMCCEGPPDAVMAGPDFRALFAAPADAPDLHGRPDLPGPHDPPAMHRAPRGARADA